MFQLRAEEVVRREESIAGRELAWERWAEKTCFFEKGTEIQHLLPAWVIMCSGWSRRGGAGPLRPSGREADSHTRQRMVFMCPSKGDCASPSLWQSLQGWGWGRGGVRSQLPQSPSSFVPWHWWELRWRSRWLTSGIKTFLSLKLSLRKKSMFHIQWCLVKKRKIAVACALMAEKSEPHQLQQGKQQCLAAVCSLYSKNIKSFSPTNRPLGEWQCLHLKSAGALRLS